MPLFKSKQERKIERDLRIKTGLNKIRRQIKTLEKSEQGYIQKALKARETSDAANLGLIKSALKRTLSQRRTLERQLLTLETASQIKDQAEAHVQFAASMTELSKSIAEAFGSIDLSRSIADFEKSMTQAESMEERMEIFLDMSEDSLVSRESATTTGVQDDEIDQLLDACAPRGAKERGSLAREIDTIEREGAT